MNKIDEAVSRFRAGFACSQAVLSTYGEDFGLEPELGLKIATGFGGGMARMGETCGAVTGAFMVIGLRYGRTRADDEESKEKTYEVMGWFVTEFRARNKYLLCRELLGCDITTAEGRQLAEERGLFSTLCPKLVGDACEILEQLL